MAIDTSRMLLQLKPNSPINLDLGLSAQRQQMKLARERFEFEKRQAVEEKELRRLEEEGRMAREAMQAERARAAAEAERQATLVAEQQKRLAEAATLAGSGKVQQAEAMSPLFDQLGINLNNLGSVGGLPVLEFQNRAQQAEMAAQQAALPVGSEGESAETSLARMGGLGYPTDERGNLDDTQGSASTLPENPDLVELGGGDPALDEVTSDALMPGDADLATSEEFAGEGIADVDVSAGGLGVARLSGQDPFARALASSRQAEATGAPTRAADEEDYMGAVPRNRIDLPAMQAQTLARLNPALQARVASLPPELQKAAAKNAAAIGGLGFEAGDAIKEMDSAMQDPVSIYNSQQNLQAQREKNNDLSRMDRSTLQTRGSDKGEKLYKERAIDKSIKSIGKAAEVKRVLDNDNREDDGMVAAAVMDAQNVVGAPSNTDLELAFAIPKGSLLTQGVAWLEEKIAGGMSDAQKKAITSYMQAVEETQKRNLNDYLNSAYETIDNGSLDPEERKGLRDYVERSVPASVYNSYWDQREKTDKGSRRGSRSAPAGEAGEELQRQAEAAGLDGGVLGELMGGESGGKTDAANDKSSAKGVFQLIDETAQAMGYADAAEYASEPLEKQIEVGLKLFKNKGLTADSPREDYALVLAAPSLVGKWKSRDDVVYKKGSPEWEVNKPWRSAGDGDITVGSIADSYLGKGGAKAEAPAQKTTTLAMPEAKTPAEKRYLELLKKRGG